MAYPPTAIRLLRRVRTRLAPAQPDFGDHGTAFGLDLSMGPADPAEAAPSVQRPAARDPGFWRRLADRRGGTPD
jgi:hypothetical protein